MGNPCIRWTSALSQSEGGETDGYGHSGTKLKMHLELLIKYLLSVLYLHNLYVLPSVFNSVHLTEWQGGLWVLGRMVLF